MMRWLAFLSLLVLALPGCVSPPPPADSGADPTDAQAPPEPGGASGSATAGGTARPIPSTTTAATPPSAIAPPAPAPLRTLRLSCGSVEGGIRKMEAQALGTCYGHTGQDTYDLGGAWAIHRLAVNLTAVEMESTRPAGSRDVAIEASLDGRAWDAVVRVPYPFGVRDDQRYDLGAVVDVPGVQGRFLRVHMPPSAHQGRAGYLDATDVLLWAEPATVPEPAPRAASGCADGLLDSAFAEHPCWSGGYDAIDEAQGGAPTGAHVATYLDESWFDAPSFFHTHYLGAGVGGAMAATVRAQVWRLERFAECSGSDPTHAAPLLHVEARASRDGQAWTDVGAADAASDQEAAIAGTLPEGTRLVQFTVAAGASYAQGGCHHPAGFLVASALTVG